MPAGQVCQFYNMQQDCGRKTGRKHKKQGRTPGAALRVPKPHAPDVLFLCGGVRTVRGGRDVSCGREGFVCRAGEEEFPADVSCGRGSLRRTCRAGGRSSRRVDGAERVDGMALSLPGKTKAGASFGMLRLVGWAQRGMIPRPSDYESAALTN